MHSMVSIYFKVYLKVVKGADLRSSHHKEKNYNCEVMRVN